MMLHIHVNGKEYTFLFQKRRTHTKAKLKSSKESPNPVAECPASEAFNIIEATKDLHSYIPLDLPHTDS